MRRLLALLPILLLNACATPAPDTESGQGALAAPLAVIAGPRVAHVRIPAPSQAGALQAALAAGEDLVAAQDVLQAAARGEIAPAVRARLVATLENFTRVPLVTADRAVSTLAIEAVDVGLEQGHYLQGSLALQVAVQVRWSRDGQLIRARTFSHRSSERPASAWNAASTGAAIKAAYAELGERIAEELLMSAGLPRAAGSACGLQWIAPRRLYRPQLGAAPSEWNRFIQLDTRTPTLAWEPLVEYARRAGGEAVGETARDVRYDLRLWQALPGAAPLLVVERQGLAATEHAIEMPLRANTKYYWSVRARFTAPDGSTRVTPWGRFRLPYAAVSPAHAEAQGLVRDPCLVDFMAEPNYYRFATPPQADE